MNHVQNHAVNEFPSAPARDFCAAGFRQYSGMYGSCPKLMGNPQYQRSNFHPAATINRTMHSKLDHFIVHPRETHPLRDVLKNTKKDTNRPFLHTLAPSSF
jgi:hypothetical protein